MSLLGFGLIGGSVAKALRSNPDWEVRAWSPSGDGPRAAEAAGDVEEAATSIEEAVDGADLVVLAAPPVACVELIGRLGRLTTRLAAGATVTDVASTKARIVEAAEGAGLPFVGGHPMAGREVTGYEAATADLFVDRPWVVVEPVGNGNAEAVRTLARDCGARPVEMPAAEHDELVAAISHLPLLASAALVEAIAGADGMAEDWPRAAELAAGGWRDTTRLARGDPAMGAGIMATNRDAVTRRLRAYRDRIDEWIALLELGDPDVEAAIEARLERDRRSLERRGR